MSKARKTSSKNRWVHPIHGKGYKSPQFDGALGPLTDKKIKEYTLRGHYGAEAKQQLEAEMKSKNKRLTSQQILARWMKLLGL